MTAYIIRRLLYAIPIIFCVNLITFTLFFGLYPEPMTSLFQSAITNLGGGALLR